MRYLLVLCLLGLALRPSARAQTPENSEIDLASKITAATVYLEGAQVNRLADTTLAPGRQTLVFTGLTPTLDKGSLQVSADDEAVLILSVSHRMNFGENAAEDPVRTAVEKQIEELAKREALLRTQAAIGREEEEILRQNRQFRGGENGLTAEELERAVAYHRQRITAIRTGYLVLEDSLQTLADRREILREQLAELGKQAEVPATGEIVVEVDIARPTEAEFRVAYLVPDAGWSPLYDARVGDLREPVDLRYRARVYQESGETWPAVKLTLSTGDPTQSAQAPELPTWRLRAGVRPPVYRPEDDKREVAYDFTTVRGKVMDEQGMPLIGVSLNVPGSSTGTVTDYDGNYTLTVPKDATELTASYIGYTASAVPIAGEEVDVTMSADGELLEEVVVIGYGRKKQDFIGASSTITADALHGRAAGVSTRRSTSRRRRSRKTLSSPPPPPVPTSVQRKATTVAFDIELPYTIPSNGRPRSVEIRQFAIPAVYDHSAVPKLNPEAYLTASLTDWEQYDLISGDLQLFFEGTYLGDSYLDVTTNDTLKLSLGRDPGVVVTRELNKDFTTKNRFLSGKRSASRGYTVRVRNTKVVPVRLTITDQVPVSGQNDIEIDHELPEDVVLNEETGKLTWTLELAPREDRRIDFGYLVRYPKEARVYLE